MGMAASQARYLSLIARMNDIEYQGQQINQQRTTLSNQVNALYNQLLEMNVPTPPSTKDYTKIEYSGKYNSSSFTIKSVFPTGDNKYTLNLEYKQAGNIMEKSTSSVKVEHQPETICAKEVSGDDLTKLKDLLKIQATTVRIPEDADKYSVYNSSAPDQKVLIVTDKYPSDISGAEVYIKGKDINNDDLLIKVDKKQADGTTYYVRCKACQLDSEYNSYITKDASNKYTNVYKTDENTSTNYIAKSDASSLAKNFNGYYIGDSNGIRAITASDLSSAENIQKILNAGVLYKADTSGQDYKNLDKEDGNYEYTITMNISSYPYTYTFQACSLRNAQENLKMPESDYQKLIESLMHIEENEDATEEDIKNNYLAYYDEKDHMVKCIDIRELKSIANANDYMNVKPWYTSTGTYSQTKEYNDCELEFDNNGRITQVTLTDELGPHTIKVSAEEVTDQDALEDAYQEYEYDKYLYDKKQQEINAKTSVIQREDKNLELKLTRLDNERNAVNTETEAVKKVIDDNIEKSYKTFSG